LNMSGGSTVWSSTLIKIMSSLFTARSSQSGAFGAHLVIGSRLSRDCCEPLVGPSTNRFRR
jgi:hypothetical protein